MSSREGCKHANCTREFVTQKLHGMLVSRDWNTVNLGGVAVGVAQTESTSSFAGLEYAIIAVSVTEILSAYGVNKTQDHRS